MLLNVLEKEGSKRYHRKRDRKRKQGKKPTRVEILHRTIQSCEVRDNKKKITKRTTDLPSINLVSISLMPKKQASERPAVTRPKTPTTMEIDDPPYPCNPIWIPTPKTIKPRIYKTLQFSNSETVHVKTRTTKFKGIIKELHFISAS